MNQIIIIIWSILVIYLSIYVFYTYLLILSAFKGRYEDLRRKNLKTAVQRHLTIIIYARNSLESLINLVNILKTQEYPQDRYDINVILENPNETSEKVLELIDNIKVWKLPGVENHLDIFPIIGKFIEKNMTTEYTNAYVLLTSDNLVKSNFLERVNIAIENNPISQACIATRSPYSSFYNSIGYINNRLNNRCFNAGRYHLGLGSQIYQSGLIVTQEFLERHQIDLTSTENELDYTFKLLTEKVNVAWAPEVIIYNRIAEDIHDLSLWKAETLFKNIKSIVNNFKHLFKSTRNLSLALNLLAPGKLIVFLVSILSILIGSLSPIRINNFDLWLYLPILLFAASIASDLFAMIVTRCNPKDIRIWTISLFSYFPEALLIFMYFLKLLNSALTKKQKTKDPVSKEKLELHKSSRNLQLEVLISDGTKNFKCSLEIKSDGFENQVSLIFKTKKYTTKTYNTLDLAFEEINNKLAQHNFQIINCFNCGFFSFSNKSHNSSKGKEGHCFYGREGKHILYDDIVKIWDLCDYYCPVEKRSEILENWKNSLTEADQPGNIENNDKLTTQNGATL